MDFYMFVAEMFKHSYHHNHGPRLSFYGTALAMEWISSWSGAGSLQQRKSSPARQ
jgi:hypothetical protein